MTSYCVYIVVIVSLHHILHPSCLVSRYMKIGIFVDEQKVISIQ